MSEDLPDPENHASFFPSSAAVNPALTIAAQAIRVADHMATADFGLTPISTAQ